MSLMTAQATKTVIGLVAAVSIGLALDLTDASVSAFVVSVIVGASLLFWFRRGSQQ